MKKITKILSLSVVVAGIVTPTVLIATSSNNITIDQGNNSVDNNETVVANDIDGDLGSEFKNDDLVANNEIVDVDGTDTFEVDAAALGSEWGSGLSGVLVFTILNDDTRTVSVKSIDTTYFAATDFNIQSTILDPITTTTYNIVSITNHAFDNCIDLMGTLTIPASVTSIGPQSFYGCTGLTALDLSNATNLKNIDAGAFCECSNLTGTLIIPASVTSIGDGAFCHGTHFTSIDLKSGNKKYSMATNLGSNCHAVINNTTGLFVSDSKIVGSLGYGELIIPNTFTSIAENAFAYCSNLTSTLTIPAGVTSIGANAFRSCSGLTGTLTIPASVTTIGAEAFNGCSRLDGTLTIPASVTTIGWAAFYGCSKLVNLDLANATSLETIDDMTFSKCSGLTGALTIPANVTSIGDGAFRFCSGLTGTLIIPASVTSISNNAFQGCTSLNGNLTIPASVTSIGVGAFQDCEKLDNLDLSKATSLETIDDNVFDGCSGLTGTLTIPASVTSIGEMAFNLCSNLDNLDLTIATNLTTIGDYAFENCIDLTGTLTIPTSVTSIGSNAFAYCSGLTGTLVIPASVTSIGNMAFSGCSKLSGTLTIPASVTSIGNKAFYNIGSGEFKFLSENLPGTLGTDIFGTDVTKTLWVISEEAKAIYKPIAITNFGLLNDTFIKVAPTILPTSVAITFTGISLININLNQTNTEIIRAIAEVGPAEATNKQVSWSLANNPDWLEIDINGDISTKSVLALGLHKFQVNAVCKGNTGVQSTAQLTVNVTRPLTTEIEVATSTPSQNITLWEAPKQLAKCTATIIPTNADSVVDWSITTKGEVTKPNWLEIDPSTGIISTNAPVTDATLLPLQIYTVQAKATDGSNVIGTKDFTINFTRPKPTSITINDIGSFNLKLGQDTPILVTCTATVEPDPGADQAVTWSIENSPAWISINPNSGAISVADATDESLIGTQTITVKAISQQDSGQSATKDFTINFARPTPTNIEVVGLGDYSALVGEKFTKSLSVKTIEPEYANPEVTWDLEDQPTGMTINQNGQITYLPTAIASKVDFKVIVASTSTSPTYSKEFNASITVTSGSVDSVKIIQPTSTSFNLILNEADNKTLINECQADVKVTGTVTQTVSWTLTNNPSWVIIDSNTGKLTIKSTAADPIEIGVFTFNIVATSDADSSKNDSVAITINITQEPIEPSSGFPWWAYLVIIGGSTVLVGALTITIVTIKRKNAIDK